MALAFEVVARFTADTGSYVRDVMAANAATRNFGDDADDSGRRLDNLGTRVGDSSDEFHGFSVSVGDSSTELRTFSNDSNEAADAARSVTRNLDSATDATRRLSNAMRGGDGGGRNYLRTDVGRFGRTMATVTAGLLGSLLLINPTVNAIIAALIGVVALLGAALIAAVALAAALIGVGAVMTLAAYKWRGLLSEGNEGAQNMKSAILAIEAEGFNMVKSLMSGFGGAGDAWNKFAKTVIDGMRQLMPYFERAMGWVTDLIAGMSSPVTGPFMSWMKTWLEEWKVLKQIAGEGIEPGGPGIFERYEAPAKAFVEGIALLINSLRKVSAMGLGLDMDQLAEFIRNVFLWLSKLIPLWARFSSALTPVALTLSEFLLDIVPLLEAMMDVAAGVMENLIAPLASFALFVTGTILKLPIISWLVSLAGGYMLAAFALSTLSFKLIKFGTIAKGQWVVALARNFTLLALRIGMALGASTLLSAHLMGFGVLAAGVAVGFLLMRGALNEVREASVALARQHKFTIAEFARGSLSYEEALESMVQASEASYDRMGWLAQRWFDVTHSSGQGVADVLGQALAVQMMNPESDLGSDAGKIVREYDALGSKLREMADNAWAGVESTGALTEKQVQNMLVVKESVGGLKVYGEFLGNVHQAYKDGILLKGQYVQILRELGEEFDDTGRRINVMALTTQGAANTIAQSLGELDTVTNITGDAFERFARNTGQNFKELSQDAYDAFSDPMGGLLGLGNTVTEFFEKQAQVIADWKTDTAESFDFVKQAMSDMAADADISWGEFIKGIEKAEAAMKKYSRNLRDAVEMDASDELLAWYKEGGIARAHILDKMVDKGPEAVARLNAALEKGLIGSGGIADTFATALEVAIEPLTQASIMVASAMLGIDPDVVARKVRRMVAEANGELKKVDEMVIDVRYGDKKRGRSGAPPTIAVPKFDQEKMATQMREGFDAAAAAAVQGLTEGFSGGEDAIKVASRAAAQVAIDETNATLGTASPSTVFDAIGQDTMAGFKQGLETGVDDVTAFLGSLQSVVTSAMTGASSWLVSVGENVMSGFLTGMKNYFQNIIVPWLRTVGGLIIDAKGPPEYDRRLLEPTGRDIVAGLQTGMASGFAGIGVLRPDSRPDVRIAIKMDRREVRRDLDWEWVSRGW